MGKINLTPEQQVELEANNSLILPHPGAKRNGSGTFHNPVTGREIHRQPLDVYHLMKRLRQGWQLGPASPELREKWVIREAELKAEDDASVAEFVASNEHVDNERARFNDAVTTAVTAVLEKLEVDLPSKPGAEQSTPAPASEDNHEGTQLSLFASVDAPPETETKHVVSEASQPALHLVD